MSIKRKFSSVVVVGAMATGAVAFLGATPANAAVFNDKLSVVPATGTTSSLLDFVTADGSACPAGTSSVQLILTGQTLTEANPAFVTGNTDLSQATGPNSNLRVQAGSTLASVFADVSISTISGLYTANLQCLDGNLQETDRYTVPMNFTSTGAGTASYVASNPLTATSAVLSGPASSTFGSNVALTAAVTPAGATGSMQFKDGATNLGSPVAVSGGSATYNSTSVGGGAHAFTAEFIPTGSFAGSTSNTLNHTVNAVTTAVVLTSNGPTDQFAPASFTATVTPSVAGTVTFKEGAATLGSSPVNAGVATFSSTSLSVGTHAVTASFVPANPAAAAPSDSNTVNHVVDAFSGASLAQTVTVTVPAGALTIVLDDVTNADGVVDLGTAVMDAAGEKLTASGEMDIVKITDTRAGDPGWVASGVATNFSNGSDEINAANLGWAPSVTSLSPNQQAAFVLGSAAAAGFEQLPSGTPAAGTGLKSSKTLGTAPNDSGNGTARLGAHLDLNIPTDVSAGLYAATLTLTVI